MLPHLTRVRNFFPYSLAPAWQGACGPRQLGGGRPRGVRIAWHVRCGARPLQRQQSLQTSCRPSVSWSPSPLYRIALHALPWSSATCLLKRAFHQNASASIVAYLRYRGRDGTARTLNAGFTRYSVILTGEPLPDGTTADAVYLILSEPYREVLTHAPVCPLDYAYLKVLTPMAQRFYELVSSTMFAVLKHQRPCATLRYGDYCLPAPQQRYAVLAQAQKQMHKVHRPYFQSGYLRRVRYEATLDEDGQPGWLLHYTPGPKARAEYAAFTRQPHANAADLGLLTDTTQEDVTATVTRERAAAPLPPAGTPCRPLGVTLGDAEAPTRLRRQSAVHASVPPAVAHEAGLPCQGGPLHAQAHALVIAFYQRFHGLTQVTPTPKELVHATHLLATHGEARARFFLAFSHQAVQATCYQPQTFGGILHYLPQAMATYTAQHQHATIQQTTARELALRERYEAYRREALAHAYAALTPGERAALEQQVQGRLVAEHTPAFAMGLTTRTAVDEALEACAGLPSFDVWRQQQEGVCGR
jgi:hypothetical protein